MPPVSMWEAMPSDGEKTDDDAKAAAKEQPLIALNTASSNSS